MSTVTAFEPWHLTFFKVSCENWKEKKEKLLNLVDWDDPKSNSEVFFSDYFKNIMRADKRALYTDEFIRILGKELNQFVMAIQKSNMNRHKVDLKIKIITLWAQRYKESQMMNPHTHDPFGYSAVLYAEFDKNEHTSTEFMAPFKNSVDTMDMTFKPDVKEGDIIFFPSMLIHYSETNKCQKNRTIFSFNCDVLPAVN